MAADIAQLLPLQLELADQLRMGRETMREPQDLPGPYGRVVAAIDRVLAAIDCEAVVSGGWAVWRHGFVGRVTQDVDIVLPADKTSEFMRVAGVSGFQALKAQPGRWPKMVHKETAIDVDILPEGERPGTTTRPAPTTIPHPSRMGASGSQLRYADVAPLIEMKLAAGRIQDEADVMRLIEANPEEIEAIRRHLSGIHQDYVDHFDRLVVRAREETA